MSQIPRNNTVNCWGSSWPQQRVNARTHRSSCTVLLTFLLPLLSLAPNQKSWSLLAGSLEKIVSHHSCCLYLWERLRRQTEWGLSAVSMTVRAVYICVSVWEGHYSLTRTAAQNRIGRCGWEVMGDPWEREGEGRVGSSGHGEGGKSCSQSSACSEFVCIAQDYLFCPVHIGEISLSLFLSLLSFHVLFS